MSDQDCISVQNYKKRSNYDAKERKLTAYLKFFNLQKYRMNPENLSTFRKQEKKNAGRQLSYRRKLE